MRKYLVLIAFTALALLLSSRSHYIRSFPLGNILKKDGYSYDAIPDQKGKVIIVTGGNAGLGKASVEALYRKNAHVILAARSIKRGEDAKASIIQKVGKTEGSIDVMSLDLSELASVRKFSQEFKAKKLPLHVLMLNAGIMGVPFQLTKDGIESHFGVNHVAHQLLTMELLDVLKQSAPSRVVSITGDALCEAPSYGVGTSLEQINDEKSYSLVAAYGQSKLANLLFTFELAKRLEGSGVVAHVVHPGMVETELARGFLDREETPNFVRSLAPYVISMISYTPEKAALTQLYAATAPEAQKMTGEYFVPVAALTRLYPHARAVRDSNLQRDLWAFTEKLTQQHQ